MSPDRLAALDLHRFRVPVDDIAALHAQVAEQGSAGCTEAEYRIFDYGLTAADRVKEVMEVVIAVDVALRCA